MRKSYIYLVFSVVIIVLAIVVGILLFNKNVKQEEPEKKNEVVENKMISTENQIMENTMNTNSIEEEKVSPKAVLIEKTKYKKCGHSIKQYSKVAEDIVNMTRQEVQKKYSDWLVEDFSSLEIIITREEEGVCDQHYLLKEKDGKIAIYILKENEQEELKEETEISTQYLTPSDLVKIQQGIRLYGEEELNSTLEDFE